MEKFIFLHGWASKYIINKNEQIEDFYRELLDLLYQKFDVDFIVLPGFSNNPEPLKPYFLSDYVDYLKNYITNKKYNNFYLMGHSFGGQVVAKFSSVYPEKVKKLILYNAACIRKKTFKKIIFSKLAKIFKKFIKKNITLSKIVYKILNGSSAVAYYSEIMKQTMNNIIEEDLSNILPYIKKETLIIWGGKDKITPLWQGKLINKLIPNSKLIIYPEGDHNFHRINPNFIFSQILKNSDSKFTF
ncbi:MAG: alpha/beta hydrolase [Patescibacteria group bacterium]|nr:alpha/beta hydrolase [Patescibacteria group bacterium]